MYKTRASTSIFVSFSLVYGSIICLLFFFSILKVHRFYHFIFNCVCAYVYVSCCGYVHMNAVARGCQKHQISLGLGVMGFEFESSGPMCKKPDAVVACNPRDDKRGIPGSLGPVSLTYVAKTQASQ